MLVNERLSATITGLVQGVGFRYTTAAVASQLGLTGRVRNQPDGSVYVVAEGPRPALERLLEFLYHGPPHAAVTSVQTTWGLAHHLWPDFQSTHDAF